MKLGMAAVLLGALAITLIFGNAGLNMVKFTGILLAFVTVVPVFTMLVNAMTEGSPQRLMKVFAGGFFFKLLVLLIGTWICVGTLKLNLMDFVVSSLSFVFALQICEALYFFSRKDLLERK